MACLYCTYDYLRTCLHFAMHDFRKQISSAQESGIIGSHWSKQILVLHYVLLFNNNLGSNSIEIDGARGGQLFFCFWFSLPLSSSLWSFDSSVII